MKSKKLRLLLALSACVLSLTLITVQAFAWFAMNGEVSVDGGTIGEIIYDAEGSQGITVELTGGTSASTGLVLLPGQFAEAELTVKNDTDNPQNVDLQIKKAEVSYPTRTGNYLYLDKYIDVDAYYKNGASYDFQADEKYIADKQAFFGSFVRPVTNALVYSFSVVSSTEFVAGVTQYNGFTDIHSVTAEQLLAESVVYETNKALPVSDYGFSGGSFTDAAGVTVTYNNGGVIIPARKEFHLYMLLRFAPDFYVTNADGITLENSNPFMSQRFVITLSRVS